MALKHLDKMSTEMKRALNGKCFMSYRFTPSVKSNNQSAKEKTEEKKDGSKND